MNVVLLFIILSRLKKKSQVLHIFLFRKLSLLKYYQKNPSSEVLHQVRVQLK